MQKNKFFFIYAASLLLLVCLGIAHRLSMEHDVPQVRLLAPVASQNYDSTAILPATAFAASSGSSTAAPFLITPDTEIVLELSDATSGLRSVQVDLLFKGESLPPQLEVEQLSLSPEGSGRLRLLNEAYADKPQKRLLRLKIDPPGQSGSKDMQVTLEARVRDHSTADWWRGNSSVFRADFKLDRSLPEAAVLALSSGIKQGGSAALVFRASEPLRSARVEAGGHKFKAYAQAESNLPDKNLAHTPDWDSHNQVENIYACLFAFPWQLEAEDYQPELVLEDLAGQIRRQPLRPLGFKVTGSVFRPDIINLSEKFLTGKAEEFARLVPVDSGAGQADASAPVKTGEATLTGTTGSTPVKSNRPAAIKAAPGAGDLLGLFLSVNNKVRATSYAKLAEYRKQSAPLPLWRGVFMRLPRSVQLSHFADKRSYIYQNKEIDRQTHLGLDLASVSRDQIPAAGSGRVLAAAYLGIHGNMVLIDHGLGLQSLYSHLSESRVRPGERVKQGQIIGLTGKSGMAGGDHLHFEFLLAGISVTPEEWLNPAWVGRIQTLLETR